MGHVTILFIEPNKNQKDYCNVLSYATHMNSILGFLGKIETSFHNLNLLKFKDFLTLVAYYCSKKYKMAFVKPLLYASLSTNILKGTLWTHYYGSSNIRNAKVKNFRFKLYTSSVRRYFLRCVFKRQEKSEEINGRVRKEKDETNFDSLSLSLSH